MQAKHLPLNWVNKIFTKLTAVYGREFSNKYSNIVDGQDLGMIAAINVWAEELGGFADNPSAIAFGLDVNNLPERPPNLIEFRAICQKAPRDTHLQLEKKRGDISVENLAKLEAIKKQLAERMRVDA